SLGRRQILKPECSRALSSKLRGSKIALLDGGLGVHAGAGEAACPLERKVAGVDNRCESTTPAQHVQVMQYVFRENVPVARLEPPMVQHGERAEHLPKPRDAHQPWRRLRQSDRVSLLIHVAKGA